MSQKNELQVTEGYYQKRNYNTLERFVSYFYQIDAVTALPNVESVFEIGPGSKLVARELTHIGYQVTTCDFDASVDPDIVADVRNLPKDKTYDLVMACQILEHIPYEDFEKTLGDIYEISNRYVVISLPQRVTYFEMIFKFPFIRTFTKKNFLDLWFGFPIRFKGFAESGQHYFEIDGHAFTKKRVRRSFNRYFKIIREFSPPLHKYHRFFILEKNENPL